MGFPRYILLTSLILFLFLPFLKAQIIFKELPGYRIYDNDSLFFDITSNRKIIPLNGVWKVHPADNDKAERVSVNVPSVFHGEGELIFEKSFNIPEEDLRNYQMKLVFFGINYSADISVNKNIIYRHPGGEFPFQIDLPKDILYLDKSNFISVKLYYKLDSENTIPLKQRFLFPHNYGGIIRDVYIHLIPNISLRDVNISYKIYPGSRNVSLQVDSRAENKEFARTADSLVQKDELDYKLTITAPDGTVQKNRAESKFTLIPNKDKNLSNKLVINDPILWSSANPRAYRVSLELWRGDELVDKTQLELIRSLLPNLIGKHNKEIYGSAISENSTAKRRCPV